MSKTIEHEGIVERTDGSRVVVRIVQASACSACAAASLCRSSESKEKTVEATLAPGQQVAVGQQVRVVGEMSMGLHATVLAYVIPLAVMLAVMAVAKAVGGSDGAGALAALLALAACYGGLWMMRDRLQREFTFRMELLN